MPMSARHYLCYTYLIGWSNLDIWYYGVRYAQVKRKQDYDLWVDYFTHSKPVKHMRAFVGEPDVIHYDKIFDSIDEARKYEYKVLQEHKVTKSKNWLNKHDGKSPNNKGRKRSNKFKQKLSKTRKGMKPSTETIEKIKNSLKGKRTGKNNPMYGKIGKNNHNYGKKLTKEHKEKISKIHKGKILSKETKEKMKHSHMGEKNHWYGKIHSKETKEKMRLKSKRIKVKINGIIYESLTHAAKELNVTKQCINYWIKKGKAVRLN